MFDAFKRRPTLAAAFSQEGFRGMLVLVILFQDIYDIPATELISPWRDAITVLDVTIVRGRPRTFRRL